MAVGGGSDDRHASVGLLNHDSDPALAFFVGHDCEFAGVGWADKAGRSRPNAELNLPAQSGFVQLQIFRKRGDDNRKNATPVLIHRTRSNAALLKEGPA